MESALHLWRSPTPWTWNQASPVWGNAAYLCEAGDLRGVALGCTYRGQWTFLAKYLKRLIIASTLSRGKSRPRVLDKVDYRP